MPPQPLKVKGGTMPILACSIRECKREYYAKTYCKLHWRRTKYSGGPGPVGILPHYSTHGMSDTRLYKRWHMMIRRCYVANATHYSEYGGRGITVCDRWFDFANFYADMGLPPTPEHSLDRINNDGNYEPSNCRWATRSVQQNNQRLFKTNKSGVRGVCFGKQDKKWLAYYKGKIIGSYDTKEQAIKARKFMELSR